MSPYKMTFPLLLLMVLPVKAQSTNRPNAFPSAEASSQSSPDQSGDCTAVACRESAFGSTPETRGKLATPPKVIHRVEPRYPRDAKEAHVQGVVVLCVIIGKDGNPRSVRAMCGPKELVPAAVQALERWRFRPYLANNEPVAASMRVVVNFRLSGIQITT